jgi:hypothetical protein
MRFGRGLDSEYWAGDSSTCVSGVGVGFTRRPDCADAIVANKSSEAAKAIKRLIYAGSKGYCVSDADHGEKDSLFYKPAVDFSPG